MARLSKQWVLLLLLVVVGLLSFAGIHWTNETNEKDHLSTTKSAILSVPSNATSKRITIPSPAIVSSIHADTLALMIPKSNRSHAHELFDMSGSSPVVVAHGTMNAPETMQPMKSSPIHVVPPLDTAMITQPAETTVKSTFIGNIFMDFYESDDRFVFAHYKSIESILHTYPLADVLTLIVGPKQLDYYKLGDNLSKHQFQKYRKRGYKVG